MAAGNRRSYQQMEQRIAELTCELQEALDQQAATSQVLQVIGRSTFDNQPVFQTVVDNATRLCKADVGNIYEFDGQFYRLSAAHGATPAFKDLLERTLIPPGRGTLVGRVGLERRTIQIPDALADPDYRWGEAIKLGGFRTMLERRSSIRQPSP